MRTLCILSMLVTMILATNASAQPPNLAPYSQNFESLDQMDGSALDTDGWQVFASVFDDLDTFKFQYGPDPAPNIQEMAPSFSNIADGEGGAAQGAQYLNTFSDYNCCDPDPPGSAPSGHQNGTDFVVASIFQEYTVTAADIGKQMSFSFDAKLPNGVPLGTNVEATAYVQTIDPANDFNTSATSFLDLTPVLTDTTWSSLEVLFDIDSASFEGQIIQFGARNKAGDYQASGVYYDNISFLDTAGIPGDFDDDGDVDGQDFLEWQRTDATASGLTDWQANYGFGALAAAVSSVPEPASAALLLLGIVCLNGTSRRGR